MKLAVVGGARDSIFFAYFHSLIKKKYRHFLYEIISCMKNIFFYSIFYIISLLLVSGLCKKNGDTCNGVKKRRNSYNAIFISIIFFSPFCSLSHFGYLHLISDGMQCGIIFMFLSVFFRYILCWAYEVERHGVAHTKRCRIYRISRALFY